MFTFKFDSSTEPSNFGKAKKETNLVTVAKSVEDLPLDLAVKSNNSPPSETDIQIQHGNISSKPFSQSTEKTLLQVSKALDEFKNDSQLEVKAQRPRDSPTKIITSKEFASF
ncbi:hypothetical protein BY996DRAFT_6422200 [Phakopsora pachyrhizi]|nr:hypothetical protein BY996DRAFT_6422200 [Phakopsora pachyrhizi]